MAEQGYMMKPLEVFAVDVQMNRATGSIPYTSLQWNRKYHECGDFSMTVPASVFDPSWRYIVTDERPETGIVQKVQYTDNPTYGNDDTVTVSGFFLESIMNRRTFLDETPEEVTRRYYVHPPEPPQTTASIRDVYKDATGKYWYVTPSGKTYGVEEGTPTDSDARTPGSEVKTDESGRTYIDTGSGRVDVSKEVVFKSNNSYYYNDGSTTEIHQVYYAMDEEGVLMDSADITHDIAFSDGFGTTYYKNGNRLCAATGVTTKEEDQFVVKKSEWRRDTDLGWVEYTETVAGPWQITDVGDVTTEQDNVMRCWGWARKLFQNQMLFVVPAITGESKMIDPSFRLLGDMLYEELKTVGASFRVEYDFQNNQFTFRVWRGLDRTQGQSGNPWAVFSDTWGSLYGYEAQRDDSNYRNTCHVLHDYDKPKGFEEDGSPSLRKGFGYFEYTDDGPLYQPVFTGWYVPYESNRGFLTVRLDDDYDDRETYLDLRDDKPECDQDWPREVYDVDEYPEDSPPKLPSGMRAKYEAFEASLTEQGRSKLETDYPVVTSLETGDLRTDRYLVDYDLGDLVDMAVNRLGIVEEARIVGASEVHESGNSTVHIEIGEQAVSTTKKARLTT